MALARYEVRLYAGTHALEGEIRFDDGKPEETELEPMVVDVSDT